ncbi:hypothetical protein L1987_71045 [Smallanthus sonchifolius]|uniref:Uncharacterized protein n=1 Tax=Smallanthus sonchifolius TaxID=185202 RepID=A0ACB9ASY2_9ASTR|nr:hypothetical protein L1987_71045 [Smallanthus sonchifolius]
MKSPLSIQHQYQPFQYHPAKKVFDICHAPGERVPYVQKTLEEANFEHNKAQPWNFKDLFKRKDYVYLSRDKLEKSYHFAANCKFNPFNQILLPTPIIQKPISKVKKDRHTFVLKPSTAKITAADQVKLKQPKGKPSVATKSAAAQVKLSAATKYAAVKPKSSDATSATEKAKRAGKPPTQQWKAKKPPSIIIGSVECVYPLL